MNPKFKLGDRVKWKDKPFLSNGYVMKVVTYAFDSCYYIVHTDNKAPNEYAWDTDKLLAWPEDIEKEGTCE